MTRLTLKIAALCTPLLSLLMLAQSARATTYYIDYATGSNSNAGTSKTAPWKTHPYMQTGSACTGGVTGWGGWVHVAGDQYIFKGGVTWPAACFAMSVPKGGTASASDYYGVDKTWFVGGSFARPLFDMAQNVPTGTHVITVTATFPGYTTFDNFEIANQLLTLTTCTSCDDAYNFAAVGTAAIPGVLIENGYIHDWVSNTNVAAITGAGVWPYSGGAIYDGHVRITVDHMLIEDSGGFVFAGTAKITGGYAGACEGCGTVSNSTFHDDGAACFTVGSCHDSEFYNFAQKIYDYCGDMTGGGNGACRPHSQIIEDDEPSGSSSGGWMHVYNNLIHDNPTVGVSIYVPYNSYVYNNVLWKTHQDILLTYIANDASTKVGYVYNNTVDCSDGNHCLAKDYKATLPQSLGSVQSTNNIFITNGTATCFSSGTSCGQLTLVSTNTRVMPTSEASTYGFTSTNKYKPASSDPNTSSAGSNLTGSCSGNFSALCQDATGAPWFGGSYVPRPTGLTGWALGAYQGQGGSGGGPPIVAITSPSAGTVSGTQTLTVTATPQGSATISSCQFTIDGFAFGSPDTSSPYTTSWNTTTAANANHVIGATCTDSNAQVGTAGTVTVTVSNSIPGCFISTDNDSGALSWTANQSFTEQSANFTATVTVTPNTAHQDSVVALSENAMSAYAQGAALFRFNSSGFIDVYKGTISNYASDNSAPYTAGTAYSFTYTINFTGPNAGTYSVSETSPSSIAIATNYAFRSTALIASLGFINAVSDNTTPDTTQVCNFQVGSAASLTLSPMSLNFGNVTVGSNSTQTITATTSGGSVSFSSVGISGNADFTINSNTCTGSVPSSCTTQIQFAPTSAALETATVTYTDAATGSPQSVAVSGTGVPATPTLSVNPTSVNFGGVQVHTTSSSGPIVLTISSGPVTFTGTPSFSGPNAADFALASNTCTGTVSASSCQTVVSFTPSQVAAESATLTYADNATGSPQTVALTGTGYLAPHPPTAVHATVE